MVHSYKYVIAQLQANPMRGERLNVAIVVFDNEQLYVHRAQNLDKLRAISGALNANVVDQALSNLRTTDKGIVDEGQLTAAKRLDVLQTMSPFSFSSFGQFFSDSAQAYDQTIARLLSQLVEPEPMPRPLKLVRKSRLMGSLKAAFRAERILAEKGEGIESHRILIHEPLADGLNADFLLKNGAMHVVQAVDATINENIKRAIQDIGVSSLIFEQAKIKFGQSGTQSRLVYSANSSVEKSISSALFAAEHQGTELVNWQSKDQRTKFIVRMSELAEPKGTQSRADFGSINASTRDPKAIN